MHAEHDSSANAQLAAVTDFPLHQSCSMPLVLTDERKAFCTQRTMLALGTALPKTVMLPNIEFHGVLLGKQTSCIGLTAMKASTTLSVTRALAA